MSKATEYVMKDVCKLSLQREQEKLAEQDRNNMEYQNLSDPKIEQLAKKINLLPYEYQSILFLKYCFHNDTSEIDKILEIENAVGKLIYIEKMLSSIMGFSDLWINITSMEKACNIATRETMNEYDATTIAVKPDYSNCFRKKLKDIKIKRNAISTFLLITKSVAIFLILCLLSFSTYLTVNVEARRKFFNWIIETYPKFSIFKSQNTGDDNDIIEPTSLKISYIPVGFELIDIKEGRELLIYNYLNKSNQKLTIKLIKSSSGNNYYYNTENAQIEEFILKGSQAYIWKDNEMTSLIWYQNGVECHITGNISREEALNIAEGILK